jgi:hypothetical protein
MSSNDDRVAGTDESSKSLRATSGADLEVLRTSQCNARMNSPRPDKLFEPVLVPHTRPSGLPDSFAIARALIVVAMKTLRSRRRQLYMEVAASKSVSAQTSEPAPAVASAVALLHPDDRDRYLEEWGADYLAISGRFRRWCWSVGLRWSAWRLAGRAQSRAPVTSGGWRDTRLNQ